MSDTERQSCKIISRGEVYSSLYAALQFRRMTEKMSFADYVALFCDLIDGISFDARRDEAERILCYIDNVADMKGEEQIKIIRAMLELHKKTATTRRRRGMDVVLGHSDGE